MATPKISLNDGKHKMIVAEAGERVLTPEQNEEYEKQHPDARRQPMRAEVSGTRMPMYQDGGDVSGVPAAPDISNLTTSRDSSGPNMNVTPSGPGFLEKVKEHAQGGGGKQLPGQTMVDIHDTPQMDQEAFDEGGDVKSAPSVTDQIKARAGEIYKQAKQAPADYGSEAEGFKQRQQNINQYNAAAAPAAPQMRSYAPVEADKLNPAGKYGMRTGEQRLNAQGDVLNPTTPQGMGAEGPQRPVPAGMRSFDCGGMVYDEGGDVQTDDDKLKAAALEQAKAEVTGAPASFGGPVIPNPKGIKVSDDTERPMAEPQKAQMSTGNAPLTSPTMNTQNASPQGPITSEASTGKPNPMVSPASTRMPEAAIHSGATDTTPLPNHGPAPRNPQAVPAQPDISSFGDMGNQSIGEHRQEALKAATPKMISPEMQAVHQDADEAMQKGDTVGLGKAAINARMLKQGEASGAPAAPAAPAMTEREQVVAQEKALHDKMLFAPTEEERAQAEKDLAELKRRTPWGSEGSAHPGMGGKIAHGISSIAQGLARGAVPYALPYIPGSQANIAAQEQHGQQGVEAAEKTGLNQAEIKLKEAQTRVAGAKTPSEMVYMHATRGGPDGGPQINPDTGKPYTDAEALQLSTGAGKAPLQIAMNDLEKQINPDTGKKYSPEEAFAKASFDASNAKMNEHQKRVADYVHAHNMEDTPANREVARVALETADVSAKQIAALPYAEQKTKFSSDLATTRALLVQQNADANQRGIEADKLQNTENARYDKVINQITLAKEALEQSDTSQFAANIVPVIATLTTTSAEGVKRINKQELDRFLPADGSLGRWASAHADKWMDGSIPPEYKGEMGKFLDSLGKSFNLEHNTNTKSIDNTVRQGAQQPTQKPEGGAGAAKSSTPQAAGGFAAWKAAQAQH
jgi:hypothetical protein